MILEITRTPHRVKTHSNTDSQAAVDLSELHVDYFTWLWTEAGRIIRNTILHRMNNKKIFGLVFVHVRCFLINWTNCIPINHTWKSRIRTTGMCSLLPILGAMILERVSSSSSITGLYSALRVLWEPKPLSSIIPKLLVANEVLLSWRSSTQEQKMKTFEMCNFYHQMYHNCKNTV